MKRRHCLLGPAAALALPGWLHEVHAQGEPRFALGVASGQPRPDGMVLWTRLTGERLPPQVPVQWELAHDEAFDRVVARGTERAEAGWAHSVHAEPAGLEPGRWYWYRFRALGQASTTGRTRTAPAADAEATLKLAIASCQRWDHGHYAAWRHLALQELDLVAFLGDYIYEYPSSPLAPRRHEGGLLRTLAQFRARYAQYKGDPALQAAHAACPWLVTWDDHELENDHAGGHPTTPLGADMAVLKAVAYQAWWEHQPLSQAQRPRGPALPLHARLDWGRLARLHLLDNRQHRDVQACPPPLRSSGSATVARSECPQVDDRERSPLGGAQERWLAEGWSRDRPWNLLLQQTLVAPRRRPGGRVWTDGWDGYPGARERLLAPVAAQGLSGVVVLGGDIHAHVVADLRARPDDPRSPVLASEFCGSSISSRGGEQSAMDTALRLNPDWHYARADQRGAMQFSLDARALRASVLAVDDPLDAASAVREAARFAVDARRPGIQKG